MFMYFLLSERHEHDNEWDLLIEKDKYKILLWEDIFLSINNSNCELKNMF